MTLLQKLSCDRRECLLLIGGRILCSCGRVFHDLAKAENHYVAHAKESEEDIYPMLDERQIVNRLREIVSQESGSDDPRVPRVTVPPRSYYLEPSEADLNVGGIRDYPCPECGVNLRDFDEIQEHYDTKHRTKTSQCLRGQERVYFGLKNVPDTPKDWDKFYFCPVPGCKYHLITSTKLNPIPSLKLLKQHYLKVHVPKSLKCAGCEKAFQSEVFLKRHERQDCGRTFRCRTCSKSFPSRDVLRHHGKVKGHDIGEKVSVSQMNKLQPLPRTILPNDMPRNEMGLLRIAPKPSHMHLSAAIALSELSAKEQKFWPKMDVGIQKDFDAVNTQSKR